MSKTLEAMAREVFMDWFVNFGPTRRKAECETDPAGVNLPWSAPFFNAL